MGRPETDLDPGLGPVQGFASELRKLRHEAGGMTYRQMARQVEVSVSTLSRAAGGEQLPSLPVALAYVRACGGDEKDWEQRWRDAVTDQARVCTPVLDETVPSPYRGLARFDVGDEGLFFGRDEVTDALVRTVTEHRVVAVLGPSGSGKSSLLRAGLIPRLRGLDAQQRPAAVRILTPGEHPLRTHDAVCAPAPGEGDTWLIVDQFEEVFTLCRDTGERADFLAGLLAAAEPGSRLRVVLGVRADFYVDCLAHPELAAAIRRSSVPVGSMTADEVRAVIVKPARAHGLIVERALTARLTEQAAGEPGSLPLLSHALLETWRRRRGRALTLEAYEATGGIHAAVAQTAEELYAHLTPAQSRLTRRILLRLITPGDGTPDTRRPVPREELATMAPEDAAAVLERLARARLITLDETTVDLAHEALLTAWPRLRAWIEEDRERLRQHRLLTDAASGWHALGRDAGALYRGTRLTVAEVRFTYRPGTDDEPDDELNAMEREFLGASLAARTRERRNRRTRTGVLSLLLALALVAGLTAWQQNRDGEKRRIEAEARRIAGVAQSLRQSDPVAAMRLGLASWRIAELPETRAALMSAMAQPEQRSFMDPNTDAAAMRQLSADGRTLLSLGSREVVEWDVARQRRKRTLPGLGNGLAGAAPPRGYSRWTPVFAGKGEGWRVHARDLATGRRGPWQANAFGGVEMGPSGLTIVTYEQQASLSRVTQQTATVRKMDTGEVLLVLPARRRQLRTDAPLPEPVAPTLTLRRMKEERGVDVIQDVTLSDDDRLLALCVPNEPVQLWDVPHRRRLHTPWAPTVSWQQCTDEAIRFTRHGRTLSVTGEDGVRSWNVATGKEYARVEHKGVYEAQYSDNGQFLAVTDRTELQIWRTQSPEAPVFRHPLRGERATQLRFDLAAGQLRYLGGPDESWGRTVHTVDLKGALTPEWRPERSAAATFSPDGTLLATAQVDKQRVRFRVRDLRPGGDWSELPSAPCRSRGFAYPWPCVSLLAFSPDSHTLVFGTDEASAPLPSRRLSFWDVAQRRVTRTQSLPPAEGSELGALAYTPDGRALLLMEIPYEGSTHLWDLDRRAATRTWKGINGHSLAFAPDGDSFVTDEGQSAGMRSGPRGTEHRFGQGHAPAFSPDGAHLATGDTSGRVTLWDVRTHRRLGELTSPSLRPEVSTLGLAFSPDSRLLAVSLSDGSLQLWDTASHQPIGSPLRTSGDPAKSIRFSPSGDQLYTSGKHIPFATYELGPASAATTVCRRAPGPLPRAEWKRLIPTVRYQDICPTP
ncbi:nSTAND1 domain-containing NTPase [Streptomyces sp. NPDC054863]